MPPWFYERRFGFPRVMRQVYLHALRHLSSAATLPSRPMSVPATQRAFQTLETDTLVVGGGPSGLAAARAMAESGASVLLVERELAVGGSARWIPGMESGSSRDPDQHSPEGVQILTGTVCLGLYEEEAVAALVGPACPIAVRFERLVVATGAYDRPLAYAGNDLPGTIGIRAFERYASEGAFDAGLRAGVVAAPKEAERAVIAARDAGIELAFVAGPAELPRDPAPSFPQHRLVAAEGRGRIRTVRLENEDPIACDVLVVGFTQPSYELQGQAGRSMSVAGEPAVIVASGASWVPTLVVGEAAGHVDVANGVLGAAHAARAWAAGNDPEPEPVPVPRLPEPAVRHSDAFACLCEDVRVRDIRSAVDDGFANAELVKRRTGAGTGACQGKLCLAEVAAVLGTLGLTPALPTTRPPTRPVPLQALAGAADG